MSIASLKRCRTFCYACLLVIPFLAVVTILIAVLLGHSPAFVGTACLWTLAFIGLNLLALVMTESAIHVRHWSIAAQSDWRLCPTCGYSLVGLDDRSRCPECGTPFSAESLEQFWQADVGSLVPFRLRVQASHALPVQAVRMIRLLTAGGVCIVAAFVPLAVVIDPSAKVLVMMLIASIAAFLFPIAYGKLAVLRVRRPLGLAQIISIAVPVRIERVVPKRLKVLRGQVIGEWCMICAIALLLAMMVFAGSSSDPDLIRNEWGMWLMQTVLDDSSWLFLLGAGGLLIVGIMLERRYIRRAMTLLAKHDWLLCPTCSDPLAHGRCKRCGKQFDDAIVRMMWQRSYRVAAKRDQKSESD